MTRGAMNRTPNLRTGKRITDIYFIIYYILNIVQLYFNTLFYVCISLIVFSYFLVFI